MLTHGSLFAGIGGFDLGFERAGMKTVWQVEIDPYCRKVLERHFPDAERFEDVRTVGKHNLKRVDVIAGGFPCQDVSAANPGGEGLDGDRSGLWFEYARIIRELRPRVVVVENVTNLLNRGVGRVLGTMAEIGLHAGWKSLRAADFGAPHARSRIWIVAHPDGFRLQGWTYPRGRREGRALGTQQPARLLPTSVRMDISKARVHRVDDGFSPWLDGCSGVQTMWEPIVKEAIHNGAFGGLGRIPEKAVLRQGVSGKSPNQARLYSEANNDVQGSKVQEEHLRAMWGYSEATHPSQRQGYYEQSSDEPDDAVCDMSQPTSCRQVDRLHGLGNAIVPQIAEWIGKRIVHSLESQATL